MSREEVRSYGKSGRQEIPLRQVRRRNDYHQERHRHHIPLRPPDGTEKVTNPATGGNEMATQLGKRYRCKVCGTEALCTKAGDGDLTCDGKPMEVQEAKAIPSSD
jgi:hypothetical protein